MDRTVKEKIRLGVFVIVGTIGLIVGVYLIGNKQNLFGSTFELSSVFKNVSGLQEGNNVRFSGINVGTVTDLVMISDTAILVNMIIQDEMLEHIRKNSIATVGSDGLVGSMLVNILPIAGNAALVQGGDQIKSYSRIATEDMMSTLSVTNENAALLTADLLKVTEALVEGKGTIGRLLNDTLLASDLSRTISNLTSASSQANSSMKEIHKVIEDIDMDNSVAGVLMADSQAGESMRRVIINLERSSTEMERMSGDLSSIIGEIQAGNGTLGYLASDTAIVKNLESTMFNLDEGTVRFSENMEAMKSNFLFRRYFKKKAKAEEKSQ